MTTPSSSSDIAAVDAPPVAARRPVVLDYGDPVAEYSALRSGALLVDHGDREMWTFRGAQSRATLAGLVTNDVDALVPGHGVYAAALTPKGRIIADVRIFALVDDSLAPSPAAPVAPPRRTEATSDDESAWPASAMLLVDVPPRAADGWAGMVRRFVNPRLATYRRVADVVRAFGVYGMRARDVLADAFSLSPSALAALPPYAHATVQTTDGPVLVARLPDLGVDGFGVYAPIAAFDGAWERVARHASVTPGGRRAYDTARIEAGYPEWGVDIDDTTIPQEANFDELHAISYTKGCYTGQEVVARVHFRGHVNRHLRGLSYQPDRGPLPTGARLFDESGKDVGDVRSAAISPRLGGVALGMVRREVPVGATLVVRALGDVSTDVAGNGQADAGGDAWRVSVGPLPFML
jgi:tRNA-modifying protein YgfZ